MNIILCSICEKKRLLKLKTKQVLELQNVIIATFAEMLEYRDTYTGRHICASVKYLEVLLNAMKAHGVYGEEISKWDISLLLPSAMLHDVGKVAISDSILNKTERLTAEEFTVMKKHTTIGVEIIERIEELTSESDFLDNAKIFAESHHERWDGSGYPYGLAGDNIPLLGRIMAVADVYEAMVSKRPYKEPVSAAKAASVIMEGRGTHFDPAIVDAFVGAAEGFENILESQVLN